MTFSFLEWLSLAGICLAGAASPGPSLAVVFGASMRGGVGTGLVAAWAHAAGVALYASLTIAGISALLAAHEMLFRAIQVGGACYLLWLALRLWRSTGMAKDAVEEESPQVTAAARDGFAVAFLNPKLALFMIALFSQFVEPSAPLIDSLLLVGTAGGVDGLWYTIVALLFTRPAALRTLRERARLIDRIFAVLVASLASYILYTVFL